jgi:hypothetical protein
MEGVDHWEDLIILSLCTHHDVTQSIVHSKPTKPLTLRTAHPNQANDMYRTLKPPLEVPDQNSITVFSLQEFS